MATAEVKSPLRGHSLDPAQVSWDVPVNRRRGFGRSSKYDWNALLDGTPQVLEIGVEIEDAVKFKTALYGKLKERSDANKKKNPGADPYILLTRITEEDGKQFFCFEAVYSREQIQGRHPDPDGLFESYISRAALMAAAFAARRASKAAEAQQEASENEAPVAEKQIQAPAITQVAKPRFPVTSAASGQPGKAPFRSPK